MYLQRDKKSGIYKYVREYPIALQGVLQGTYKRSLKTKDLKTANERFPQAHAEYEQFIEGHTLHRYSIPAELKSALLHELRERFIIPKTAKDITLPELVEAKTAVKQKLQSIMIRMQEDGDDCEVFSSFTKSYQPAKQMLDSYSDLLFRIENAERAAKGEAILGRESFTSSSNEPAYYGVSIAPSVSSPAVAYGPRLSEALEAWIKRVEPQAKTLIDWRYSVRRFTELQGDVHVAAITRKMCREYRDALQSLPIIKSNKIRNLPIKELLKMVDDCKLDMSDMPANRTINKMLDGLRSVIQVAIDEYDELSHFDNPVRGVSLNKKVKYTRLGFSEEDLVTLIQSPLYSGCAGKSKKERKTAGNLIIRDELFWIPLISLFSGARQEEVAQLFMIDVFEDAPIPYYHINAHTEERRIKNEESDRRVPIHNELIKCGLLQYIREIRSSNELRLFPEISRNNLEKRYAKNLSRDFNEYLETLGIKPPPETKTIKDFHSFRHLFKSAARDAEMLTEIHHYITGHKSALGVGEHYGGYSLKTVNNALQKLEYPFIDLSHLYVSEPPASAKPPKKRLKLIRSETV